jgi:hypothetical protein
MIVRSSQTKSPPNIACTRLVGVATFSGNFPGSKRVPSKRQLLVHMAWLTEYGALPNTACSWLALNAPCLCERLTLAVKRH